MKIRNQLRKFAPAVAGASAIVLGNAASAQVVLPDTGVDVAGAVTATITGLGAVVLVVVGGYFAFLLVRKGMQWGRKAFS